MADVFFILPKEPLSVEDRISAFVEKAQEKDLMEDVTGLDEELAGMVPYDAQQYYEYTIQEIADEMGMTHRCVRSILHRARHKIMRRLLILAMLPVAPEEEILGVIRDGEEAILNKLRLFL